MKNFTVGVLVAALSLIGMDVIAGQKSESPPAGWNVPATAIQSSRLIGARIKTAANKDLGEIDDLLVDETDGKVTHVVIGKGGLTGIGETKVVMPWSDLTVRTEKNRIWVVVDPAVLDAAPLYDKRWIADQGLPAASPRTEEKKK
jgi:sporulation protein YlmC with PRC-barrel domain